MTPSRHGQAFIDQLLALIPGAAMGDLIERPWHSATFTGLRMQFPVKLTGDDASAAAAAAAHLLPDHEFILTRHFVAELTVGILPQSPGYAMLAIEALLLEE